MEHQASGKRPMTGAERQRRFIHRLRAVTPELEKARKRIEALEAELSDARQEVAKMRDGAALFLDVRPILARGDSGKFVERTFGTEP